MRYRTLALIVCAGVFGNVATAQTLQLVCENWHPRLGQMNDMSFVIDVARQSCNGNPCKISDGELSWSEGGGRYEYVINRLSGEGQARVAGSAEPVAVLKSCRSGEKSPDARAVDYNPRSTSSAARAPDSSAPSMKPW